MVGASGEPLGVSAFQNLSLGTDQMRMVLAHPLCMAVEPCACLPCACLPALCLPALCLIHEALGIQFAR
jgi:hypothetical protein